MTYIDALTNNLDNFINQRSIHAFKQDNSLILKAGIYDRFDIAFLSNIRPHRFIPDYMKGILKSTMIQTLIYKTQIQPDSIYFYDDIPETVQYVKTIGVNSTLCENGLDPKQLELLIYKKQYDDSVKMILLDFDKTLSLCKIKKKSYNKPASFIVEKFMGGFERMNKIFTCLKKLESLGVRIGIITMNLKSRIKPLLIEMNWLN